MIRPSCKNRGTRTTSVYAFGRREPGTAPFGSVGSAHPRSDLSQRVRRRLDIVVPFRSVRANVRNDRSNNLNTYKMTSSPLVCAARWKSYGHRSHAAAGRKWAKSLCCAVAGLAEIVGTRTLGRQRQTNRGDGTFTDSGRSTEYL